MIDNINTHLDQLEEILNDWALWMKPHAESKDEIDDIIPRFERYVAIQLEGQGLTPKAIAQYEAANPSWMSVGGLMRYWLKKFESQ